MVGLFNVYNNIIAEVSPVHARIGWLPSKYIMPVICRFLSLVFYLLAVAMLYFTETVELHWIFVIIVTIALIFTSSLIVSTFAWIIYAKKYPLLYEGYRARKEMENIFR